MHACVVTNENVNLLKKTFGKCSSVTHCSFYEAFPSSQGVGTLIVPEWPSSMFWPVLDSSPFSVCVFC